MKKYFILAVAETALLFVVLAHTYHTGALRLVQGILYCGLFYLIGRTMKRFREKRTDEDMARLLRLKPYLHALFAIGAAAAVILLILYNMNIFSGVGYGICLGAALIIAFPMQILYYLATKEE